MQQGVMMMMMMMVLTAGNLVSAYYGPGVVLSTSFKGILLQSFLQSLEHDDAISIPIS